jgi:hypothetical protein
LTPREAQERLAEILNVAERSAPASAGRTFGEACDEWLRYVEHERQRSTSTPARLPPHGPCASGPGLCSDTPLRSASG